MKQTVIIAIIVGSVIGIALAGGLGYLAGYLVHNPKIETLEAQTYYLTSEVSGLEDTVSDQEAEISTSEHTISIQQDNISALEDTISAQQDAISYQAQQVSDLERSNSTLQGQLSQVKTQLTAQSEQLSSLVERLDGLTVTHHYTWHYRLRYWHLDLPVTMSSYVESKERSRPTEWSSYADIAKDTEDDSYIYQVVYGLNEIVQEGNLTESQTLDLVVTFIQSLPYIVSNVTTPYDGYPRYPIETLFEREGDSEDTSILAAALLYRMGYDVALLVMEDAKHMAVGVSLPGDYGTYYEDDGTRYFYLETTQLGWGLGIVPSYFLDQDASVYPMSS